MTAPDDIDDIFDLYTQLYTKCDQLIESGRFTESQILATLIGTAWYFLPEAGYNSESGAEMIKNLFIKWERKSK